MFGFACDETDVLMPTPIYLAHNTHPPLRLKCERTAHLLGCAPDGKAQVTVEVFAWQAEARGHSFDQHATRAGNFTRVDPRRCIIKACDRSSDPW